LHPLFYRLQETEWALKLNVSFKLEVIASSGVAYEGA
jgi:hypothetical protein